MWRDAFMWVGMTHSHVSHDSFTYVTWLVQMCWHDSFIRLTRFILTRDMTHARVWYDSFIRVTWMRHDSPHVAKITTWSADVPNTHLHIWHDSFEWVPWCNYMRDVTYAYVSRDSFICDDIIAPLFMTNSSRVANLGQICWQSPHLCTCMTWLTHIRDTMYSHVWNDVFVWVTWLIHTCDMTAPWLTASLITVRSAYMPTTHSDVWDDSCIRV